MLIEFKVTNFRSFRTTQTLSMVAAPYAEHAERNTFDSGLPGFNRLLRSTVVYGANAAGKTNLLKALQFMKALVISSAKTPESFIHNPFKFASATRTAPTEFEVTFADEQIRYVYGFTMDSERVRAEWLLEYLHARAREIFRRTYDDKTKKYEYNFSKYLKGQREAWKESTRDNSLFLSTAVQLNSRQLTPVFWWFEKRLQVIVGPTKLNQTLTFQVLNQPDGKEKLLPLIREADLGITDLVVERQQVGQGGLFFSGVAPFMLEQQPGRAGPNLLKVTFTHRSDETDGQAVLDLEEESAGTKEFFKNAGTWLNVLKNGEVLLIDEIDASLHPLLTQFLVEKFHSDTTNPFNAQLIFNTHNTSLLRDELFRRDQVWFVEKEHGGSSKLYPLAEFKPRAGEALEKGYLLGRYGAIPILGEQ